MKFNEMRTAVGFVASLPGALTIDLEQSAN
jgi:hypothetical protein